VLGAARRRVREVCGGRCADWPVRRRWSSREGDMGMARLDTGLNFTGSWNISSIVFIPFICIFLIDIGGGKRGFCLLQWRFCRVSLRSSSSIGRSILKVVVINSSLRFREGLSC
jgi:hypothetical protein